MSEGSATYMRTAEITSPEVDEIVYGDVHLAAWLDDKDGNDNVQWAVREGTCAAGTNTVAGNVDGFSDDFMWDGSDFSAVWDSSGATPGMYCFIFNPTESAGDLPIRETREFYVDEDGVIGDADFCPNTIEDDFEKWDRSKGRYMWDGDWQSSGKGDRKFYEELDMAYTHGCSGTQILDSMSETLGEDFGGHYKHGLSKSILQAWHDGTYHVGPTYVETVEVPANDTVGVVSVESLTAGVDYYLEAYGTAYACNQVGCVIEFDADFSTSDDFSWLDGVAAPYDSYGPDLLDLKVNGNFVDWGSYNESHEYLYMLTGTGSAVNLLVYDIYYPNNTGSLFVDIVEDKWADLW
jgi:hypothetical protein